MTTYKHVQPNDFDFANAPAFRKVETVPVENVIFASGGEKVITRQRAKNGTEFVETENRANAGDAIVTRTPVDTYVISAKAFANYLEIDPANPGRYRSKNFGRAVQVLEDCVIAAPWKEDQYIEAGGVIYRNGVSNEVYGNQQHSFEGDFAREAADGSLMRLTEPLKAQLAWAVKKGEGAHAADVRRRMAAEAGGGG
jgi:hypothetical protein